MNIIVLLKILLITYFISINTFAFFLVHLRRKKEISKRQETDCIKNEKNDNIYAEDQATTQTEKEKKISNSRLFITALLGGGLGVYIAMFVFKFKLSNFFFMVFIPVIIALNIYLLVCGIINGLWLQVRSQISLSNMVLCHIPK